MLTDLDLASPAQASHWCADDDEPATPRQAAFLGVWHRLSVLPDREREAALDRLADWAGGSATADPDALPLSLDEAARLSASRLIEIGAHTVSHPSLPELDRTAMAREVGGSRRALEERFARPVTTFSFPHGRSDGPSRQAVREAGFRAACTSHGGVADRFSNRFDLPRVHVKNWDGERFAKEIRGYVRI
jgi:peptidoglycan/xylan/chitin deacetylase (PgdA/CDA1 family)